MLYSSPKYPSENLKGPEPQRRDPGPPRSCHWALLSNPPTLRDSSLRYHKSLPLSHFPRIPTVWRSKSATHPAVTARELHHTCTFGEVRLPRFQERSHVGS